MIGLKFSISCLTRRITFWNIWYIIPWMPKAKFQICIPYHIHQFMKHDYFKPSILGDNWDLRFVQWQPYELCPGHPWSSWAPSNVSSAHLSSTVASTQHSSPANKQIVYNKYKWYLAFCKVQQVNPKHIWV